MDSLRGNFAEGIDLDAEAQEYDPAEDETGRDEPPASIGQDERRMQVRAYNHWASLLGDRNFPSIEDLDPENLDDFGPYSVLLDFTSGIENPGVSYLGDKLARECDASDEITQLSDVPSRSLLSRITDHYMQILANQAPIGFEAEFVNQRGITILYRGILLPFSTDDDQIDFIYGVINWKEMADQLTTDELLLEIDQALDNDDEPGPSKALDVPLSDWADGPIAEDIEHGDDILDLTSPLADGEPDLSAMPEPRFGKSADEDSDDGFASLSNMMMPKRLREDDDSYASYGDDAFESEYEYVGDEETGGETEAESLDQEEDVADDADVAGDETDLGQPASFADRFADFAERAGLDDEYDLEDEYEDEGERESANGDYGAEPEGPQDEILPEDLAETAPDEIIPEDARDGDDLAADDFTLDEDWAALLQKS